jgi:methyl-accepting chemotaxis protein
METKNFLGGNGMAIRKTSIKRRMIGFSIAFFIVILAGGTMAFFFSMRQIVRTNTAQELSRLIENKSFQLEASVNNKIAIALTMANSPLIKHFLAVSYDPDTAGTALEEIAAYHSLFQGDSLFWINDIERDLYVDGSLAYHVDPAAANQEWYNQTMYQTEKYIFTIGTQVGNDGVEYMNLWLDVPVFIENKKSVGVVGAAIKLSDFITDLYRSTTSKADFYLFNGQGEITGARDTKLVADKKKLTEVFGNAGTVVLEHAPQARNNTLVPFSYGDVSCVVGYIEVLDWYIVSSMPLTAAMYLNTAMTGVFLAMLFVVLLIFIIFNGFIGNILKPLRETVKVLTDISTNWDLTKRLDIHTTDEIGDMADMLNLTFEKMKGLILTIKNQTVLLAITGEELATNMIETAAAITEITANIQNMDKLATHQSEGVTKTGGTMESIMNRVKALNSHITAQSTSVSQSASSIEEMLANIHSVAEILVKNADNVSTLSESSEIGKNDLQTVSEGFQEIARESEGLMEINEVMNNIASQTNLLSMNAAIEAAHAGEVGKGFAVVADEIRKLAESSAEQSKTTADMLKKIKVSIATLTLSTAHVLERFETIDNNIQVVSRQEQTIRSAMEEQEQGSKHILDAVMQLKSVTATVTHEAGEMETEGQEVIKQSTNLEQITAEITNGMDEMATGAEQINIAVIRVNEISGENKSNIDSLSGEVAKFKVE